MRIEFYFNGRNEYRWRAVDDNERLIAVSGIGYLDLPAAEADFVALCTALESNAAPVVHIYPDPQPPPNPGNPEAPENRGGRAVGYLRALVEKVKPELKGRRS